jgi:hypothetical protein
MFDFTIIIVLILRQIRTNSNESPNNVFPTNPKGDAEWERFKTYAPELAGKEQGWLNSVFAAQFYKAKDGEKPSGPCIVWHHLELDMEVDNENLTRFLDVKYPPDFVPPPDFEIDNNNPSKYMHVLELPCGIPGSKDLGRNFLFVRSDTLELFKIARSLELGVMIGNPGIGKSYFQWIYLLFVIRPDIYKKMTGEDNLPPIIRRDPDTGKVTQSFDAPEVVVRMVDGGKESFVYFLKDKLVFKIEGHPGSVADLFNYPTTLLLWEPEASKEPIIWRDEMQIFATVSQDDNRYNLFEQEWYSLLHAMSFNC